MFRSHAKPGIRKSIWLCWSLFAIQVFLFLVNPATVEACAVLEHNSPGDWVDIPKSGAADAVYISGRTASPGRYTLSKLKKPTLCSLLEASGGLLPDADWCLCLSRQFDTPALRHRHIGVSLLNVLEQCHEDIQLRPGDSINILKAGATRYVGYGKGFPKTVTVVTPGGELLRISVTLSRSLKDVARQVAHSDEDAYVMHPRADGAVDVVHVDQASRSDMKIQPLELVVFPHVEQGGDILSGPHRTLMTFGSCIFDFARLKQPSP